MAAGEVHTFDFTILAGAAVSDAREVVDYQFAAFWMPSTAAAWTAANLTMEVSRVAAPAVDADWRQVFLRGGTELILPAALGRVLVHEEGFFIPPGTRWLRLISGVAGTRVNQVGANRTITAVFRRRG